MIRQLGTGLLLGILLGQSAFAASAPCVVTQIDGTKLAGQLVGWDATGLKLQTDDGEIEIKSTQLLRVRWNYETDEPLTESPIVELVDGTRLPFRTYAVTDGQATIASQLSDEPLSLPTDLISTVQFLTNSPAQEFSEQMLSGNELEGDVLIVRKKSGSFDSLTGLLGDVSAEQVLFKWDGETIPVKRAKVASLVYFHANEDRDVDPIYWLKLRNGGRLPIFELESDEQRIHVRTSAELEFSLPKKLIVEADYSQGKLAYLSDLRPIKETWTPRINLPTSADLIQRHGLPRRDQSFAGSAITLFWPSTNPRIASGELKAYEKGLALRSRTESRYRLPKGMQRFAAIAGIDPETAGEGNVSLEIFADRRSVWQGEIAGGAAPTSINVVLGKARELRILVDYGENLDFGDRLHLVEARVSQ